jgi:hypothetical protein
MASVSSGNATLLPPLCPFLLYSLLFFFLHLYFSFMLVFSLAYTSLLNFMIASLQQRSPFPRMTTNVNALVAQNRFLLKDNWKKMFTVLPEDIPSSPSPFPP